MLTDGLQLLGASTASNFTIDNGPDLPTVDNNLGELFFQVGVGLHVYTASGWTKVGTPDAAAIAEALGFTPAALDVDGKLVINQLPPLTITNTFVAANQAEMLGVTAETGDVVVRTDLRRSYILKGDNPGVLANWQELLTPSTGVESVNTQTGAVTLTTANIPESTSLYFTNARARTAISVTGGGATYDNATGVISVQPGGVTSVNTLTGAVTLTTSNVGEGTNQYFTNARARSAISVTGTGGSYDSATGVITLNSVSVASSGTAGAIQLSDGAGGFTSDATDFYWTSATNTLTLGHPTAPAIITARDGTTVSYPLYLKGGDSIGSAVTGGGAYVTGGLGSTGGPAYLRGGTVNSGSTNGLGGVAMVVGGNGKGTGNGGDAYIISGNSGGGTGAQHGSIILQTGGTARLTITGGGATTFAGPITVAGAVNGQGTSTFVNATFSGTAGFSSTVTIPYGTVGAPSLAFASDTTTGIYGASGTLSLTTGGVQRAVFNSTATTFTGTVNAPTPSVNTSSTQVATTAYVKNQGYYKPDVTVITWDPTVGLGTGNGGISYSNGNLTANFASTYGQYRYAQSSAPITVKGYFELTPNSQATSIGLMANNGGITFALNLSSGVLSYNGVTLVQVAAHVSNDIYGVAFDPTTLTATMYRNGTVIGSKVLIAANWYAYAYDNQPVATAVTANFGAMAMAYTVPAGYQSGIQPTYVVAQFNNRFGSITLTSADVTNALTYTPVNPSQLGAASGIATLDATGKLTSSQTPAIAISDTFVVASQAEMLAVTGADVGDVAVRTDIKKTFILKTAGAGTLANWQEMLTPTDAVTSVNGQVGVVTLGVADIAGAAYSGANSNITSLSGLSYGALGTPSITFAGDNTTGLYGASGTLSITAGGTQRAVFNATGATFTGTVAVPNPPAADNSTTVATTAFVKNAINVASATGTTSSRQLFTATAGQTTFAIAGGYTAGFIDVFLNGAKQRIGTDVTASDGTAIVFTTPLSAGEEVDVSAFGTFNVANTYDQATIDAKANQLQFRNRLINGGLIIDQRNAVAETAIPNGTNYYIGDRWHVVTSMANRLNGSRPVITDLPGVSNCILVYGVNQAASAAADVAYLQQLIEGYHVADSLWGTAQARPAVLSFMAKSFTTAKHSGAIRNGDSTRSYPFTFDLVAGVWTRVEIQIPGCSDGVWDKTNGKGVSVVFNLGTGTNALASSANAFTWLNANNVGVVGAVGVANTATSSLRLVNLQFEFGEVGATTAKSTSFEFRPFTIEEQLCQRYFVKRGSDGSGLQLGRWQNWNQTSSSTLVPFYQFPVKMRRAPLATEIVVNYDVQDGTTLVNTSGMVADPSPDGFCLSISVPAYGFLDVHSYAATAEL